MSKFLLNITKSNKDIKEARAARVAKAAERAQRTLVDSLEKEVEDLEAKVEEMDDLSPESAYSLRPVKDAEWNADKWVKDLQAAQINLMNKKLELDVARATYDKYFVVEEKKEEAQA